jgi:hypothetical protein
MKIDIDKLTEVELIDLNNRIVERLRLLSQMRAHGQMLQFKIGDRVSFRPDGHPVVVGMLTRYNRRTVTIITDSGQRWNVAPALLQRAENLDTAQDLGPNVIQLHKKGPRPGR